MTPASEIGFTPETYCLTGKWQAIERRIAELKRESRRASPLKRKFNDAKIHSLKLLLGVFEFRWNRGEREISFSDFDALAKQADEHCANAVTIIIQDRTIKALNSQIAATKRRIEAVNRGTHDR